MSSHKRFIGFFLTVIIFAISAGTAEAEQFIVKEGKPNAEIVVAEVSPRMTSFAALELQYYIEKMSGAKVPIIFEKSDTDNIKIYVGKSKYTDELGIDDKGLKYGAFHMHTGKDYLVLLGNDSDYHPSKPYAMRRNLIKKKIEEWDKKTEKYTDLKWGSPVTGQGYEAWWKPNRRADKFNEFMEKRYGKENRPVWNPKNLEWKWGHDYFAGLKNGYTPGFWRADQHGSLNAVYSLLRGLGAEWYMPGKIGEVIPEVKTISLPEVAKTEKPDFAMRYWHWPGYWASTFDNAMWERRLGMGGMKEVFGVIGPAHGLVFVHKRKEMKQKHSEYYALDKNGKRITDYRGTGHVCLSSEGFINETLKFARFMYDVYDAPHVSLFPQDGFRHCQCEKCKKLSTSDLVWGFVNRVARELYKTHPDRIVSCSGYSSYAKPPQSIKKFPPNVLVIIGKSNVPLMDDPIVWEKYVAKVKSWKEKVSSGMLTRGENNFYHRSEDTPFAVIHPHNMAKDLQFLKGTCLGETAEGRYRKGNRAAPGCDHLNLYVQARFMWDADQDIDKVLDEYYHKFYGPAAKEMKAALDFAEAKYSRIDKSRPGGRCNPANVPLPTRIKLLELLHKARDVAGDNIYGQRIDIILGELPDLEKSREELKTLREKGNPRDDAFVVEAYGLNADDSGETYKLLRTAQRRRPPELVTTFNVKWAEKSLTFNIRCEEPDMESVKVGEQVWEGDSIVLVLESPYHSYYQIEVSPDGRVFDADRWGSIEPRWSSLADVKIEKGKDYWSAKISIPIAIVGEESAEADPMNFVVSPRIKPGQEWFFNIGRRRPREGSRDSLRKTYVLSAGGAGGRNMLARDAFSKLVMK